MVLVKKNCYLTHKRYFVTLELRRGFSKQNLIKTSSNCPIFGTENPIGDSNFNKSYFDELTCEGLLLVKKGVFPMQRFNFKAKLENKITDFLTILAKLSDSNNIYKALKLIEEYVFNFCIRVYIIYLFKKQKPTDPFIKNLKLTTYKKALYFLKITQLKNLQKPKPFTILIFEIEKKERGTRKLDLSSILERILQKQFKLLLDPIIDTKLYKFQFGYRKGRSALQFMARLHKYLTRALPKNLNVLKININKCCDRFLHKKILENFPWPKKFNTLLLRWLAPKIYVKNNKKQNIFISKLKKGLIQGEVLSPLIRNFLLSICLKETTKNFEQIVNGKKHKKYGICLNFADEFIFCCNDKNICDSFLRAFTTALKTFGLFINQKKTALFTFVKPMKFEMLGWTIYSRPQSLDIKKSNLMRNHTHIKRINSKIRAHFWLFYPANKHYKSIKKYIKKEIKKLTKDPLWKVLLKVNYIIQGFCNYFNYSDTFGRLNSLNFYCYKNWKKFLVKKFRFRGIRRPRWVLRQFFGLDSEVITPSKQKYQIRVKVPTKKFKLIWQTLPTKLDEISSLQKFNLPVKITNSSYYLKRNEFLLFKFKCEKLRFKKSKQEKLERQLH